ncbi:hypothetical protein QUB63_30330 [Microcoleus sp. ARI1-B5]|uniref:hypothetical protein n=1 Tax=unclassified Microcoleus TaxID=2642155 RepID=UPI002FCF5DAD
MNLESRKASQGNRSPIALHRLSKTHNARAMYGRSSLSTAIIVIIILIVFDDVICAQVLSWLSRI